MHKKGQITVFIWIGILILGIFFMLLYAKSRVPPVGEAFEKSFVDSSITDFNEVEIFVTACLDDATRDAIRGQEDIGTQNSLLYIFPNTTEKTIQYNSVGDLQTALASQIKINFQNCVDNFDAFRLKNYNISLPILLPDVTVSIFQKDMMIKLDYPIDVSSGAHRERMNDFMVKHKIS